MKIYTYDCSDPSRIPFSLKPDECFKIVTIQLDKDHVYNGTHPDLLGSEYGCGRIINTKTKNCNLVKIKFIKE